MNRITLAPSILALPLTSLLALGVSLGDAEAQTTACDSKIQALEINGTTLHYLECGKGEPLVFVHGGLGDLHTFQAQVQAFAASFRVIAYSRRFSPPNAPPRETDVNPLSTHVADLRALIDATERGSGASRGELVGRVHRARAGTGASRARAQPCARRAARPAAPLPHVSGRRPCCSRGSGGSSSHHARHLRAETSEDGMRKFMDGICGRPGCFDNLPASPTERCWWKNKRQNCDRS